jgi:hypothetical protein
VRPGAAFPTAMKRLPLALLVCALAGGALISWHLYREVAGERSAPEAIEPAPPQDAAQTESGQTEPERSTVDALVEQLVSPDPPKYPNGTVQAPRRAKDAGVAVVEAGYVHPSVKAARERLVAMGTEIYPELAEHIDDDRYSYSVVSAAWENATVGFMIARIMAEGIEPRVASYKSRENPSGSNVAPSFDQMVREVYGYRRYAFHAKERSKRELQQEYVRWRVERERDNGFIDKKQEQQVVGDYVKILEGD